MTQLGKLYTDISKPYRDQSLTDRPVEKWKPVPGFEHYLPCQILEE